MPGPTIDDVNTHHSALTRRDRAKRALAVATGASAALTVGGTGVVAALVAGHQDHVEQDRRAAKARALADQSPVVEVEALPAAAVAPVVLQRPQRTVVDPAVVVAVSAPGAASPGVGSSARRASSSASRSGTASTTRTARSAGTTPVAPRTTVVRSAPKSVTKAVPKAVAPRPAPPPAPSSGS